tara:strand:+ start:85 stop:732 length:648 start_codon:yes stop_codon:yes gene_type:complete
MTLPFIVEEHLENDLKEIKLASFIYIKKNVFSTGEMQDIREAIDKYANISDDYSKSNNVKCKYVHFTELFDYNPTIALGIEKGFMCIQRQLYTQVCRMMQTVNYYEMHLRKIDGPTRSHVDGVIGNATPTPSNYINKPTDRRLFSVIVALNSDYEGGEFIFPKQDVSVKLKAGEALIFPPYWTHPHSTNELNGTFRYTINSWLYECNQVSKPVCE